MPMSRSEIRAELLFLVVKLLEEESCTVAAESLKAYINDKKILPDRINTDGKCFTNTFENFETSLKPVKPTMLLENVYNLIQHFKQTRPNDASRLSSLFTFSLYLDKKTTLAFPTIDRVFCRSFNREDYLTSLHRQLRPSNHCLAHRNAIYCIQQDQRNEFVFTGSDDYTIKIWDVRVKQSSPFKLRHTLRGHIAEIIELAISPDNHLLASVDSNCCLIIWCLRTGEPVIAVRGSHVNRVISGMSFLTIPPEDESLSKETISSDDPISGWLAITSFGGFLHMIPYQHVIIHSNDLRSFGSCCTVKVLPTVRFITGVEGTHNAFWPSVVCMDVSPGSLLIATGCSDQCIRLYHLLNPRKPEFSIALRAHEDSVNSLAFSHSGLKLASGSTDGGSCWLWNYQAGKWRSLSLSFRKRVKCRPCLLAWSKSDRYLIASMKNGTVYIYFGDSGRLCTVIDGHEGAVHAISPSPLDDEIVATAGVDGRFQVWNIRLQRLLVRGDSHSQDSDPYSSTNSASKALLYHYRYASCMFDPDHGLIWHPLEPSENQPLGGWLSHQHNGRRLQRDLANSMGSSQPDQSDLSQRPILPTIGNNVSFKGQRITACRSLPPSEGIGFLVMTKSGLLSVFRHITLEDPEADDSVGVDQASLYTDERFFHWELDTAEWKEVSNVDPDPSIPLVLGSPPSSQSVADHTGPRYSRDGRTARPGRSNPVNTITSAPAAPASSALDTYRPPKGVCFEVIHAPSQVPFHRLPPPYLTTLRGTPLPMESQRLVPGRSHLTKWEDLMPTVSVDEEVGDDVVIDDIQFCPNVPSNYCTPSPVQSQAQRIPGKQYLWQSIWLDGSNELLSPLSEQELQEKMAESRVLRHDEVEFFLANGDAHWTFGDELSAMKPQGDTTIPMQPIRPNFRLSNGSVREPCSGPSALPSKRTIKQKRADTANFNSTGMSFIHTFITETRSQTDMVGRHPNQYESTETPSSQPLPQTDDLEEQEEQEENDSEESEWSEHMDVDIGWWNRRRRRRRRRNRRSNPSPTEGRDITEDGEGNHVVHVLGSERARSLRSTHVHRRRSMRRRALARRRMLSDKRLERERRRPNCRRTLRSRTLEHQTHSSDLTQPSVCNTVTDQSVPCDVLSEEDLISERRERLKRRLIRSIDDLVASSDPTNEQTAAQVPVTQISPGSYEGPNCEGCTYPNTIEDTVPTWSGPHFDWLSTYHPVPSPYVPQVGDRLVYIQQGHREYLRSSWKHGKIPQPDRFTGSCVSETVQQVDITLAPWDTWPKIPLYVCAQVHHITYTIIRVCSDTSTPQKNRSNPPSRRKPRTNPAHASANQHRDDSPSGSSHDSFVRLVTLHLSIEENQPYASLGNGYQHGIIPQSMTVTYHDVDGVLDFLILRHIFDAAVHKIWNPGDVFICPVGTAWWRGRIIDLSSRPITAAEPIPSCSNITPSQPDPWLTIQARWLDGIQSTDGFTERLSPWDLHSWNHADLLQGSLETPSSTGLRVHPERLQQLYGSSVCCSIPSPGSSSHTTFAHRTGQIADCIKKIMELPASEHFASPVDLALYPDYLFVNPNPIDLSLIHARLCSGFYRQLDAVRADIQHLFDNTLRYNEPDSAIVSDAHVIRELCMRTLSDPACSPKTVEKEYSSLLRTQGSSKEHASDPSGTQTHPSTSSSSANESHPSTGEHCCCSPSGLPAKWSSDCLSQISRLLTHRQSIFFREPIDTELYPDYLDYVHEPMDFSTIQRRLKGTITDSTHSTRFRARHRYQCPHECLRDIRLIVSNSQKYNRNPSTAVFDDTQWLSNWVESEFVPYCDRLVNRRDQADRPSARIRIRQSKLACRKLALRRNRKYHMRQRRAHSQKPVSDVTTLQTTDATDSLPVQRTSSGRIVRPPKRDANTISNLSDHELSGDEEPSPSSLSSSVIESELRRSKRQRRSAC